MKLYVLPNYVIQFGISVFSTKDTLEAAQGSVKRRTDYILQVFRNNGIKEKSWKLSTNISRQDDDCVQVQTDIVVDCDGVLKCETVRNLLIEKLDSSSVRFTPVTYHHLSEDKAEKRYIIKSNVKYSVMNYLKRLLNFVTGN